LYAYKAVGGRWRKAEEIILRDAEASFCYARDVIKGRWRKGENTIMQESRWALEYARKVLKSQLPGPMYNFMILRGGDDPYLKKYLAAEKKLPPFGASRRKKAKKGNGRR
jgi:methionine synthase II (cobalamin-independent)